MRICCFSWLDRSSYLWHFIDKIIKGLTKKKAVKAVINTLTWPLYAADLHPVNTSRNRSSAVAFRPDLQVPSWESMCYTSPTRLPNLLLPCFQSHLLTDVTAHWHHTHMRLHKTIHTYTAYSKWCPRRRVETNIWQNINTLRITYLSFKCDSNTLSTRLYLHTNMRFLSLSHVRIYIFLKKHEIQQSELMCSQPALCLSPLLLFTHAHACA